MQPQPSIDASLAADYDPHMLEGQGLSRMPSVVSAGSTATARSLQPTPAPTGGRFTAVLAAGSAEQGDNASHVSGEAPLTHSLPPTPAASPHQLQRLGVATTRAEGVVSVASAQSLANGHDE
jgi:hypothetical protein